MMGIHFIFNKLKKIVIPILFAGLVISYEAAAKEYAFETEGFRYVVDREGKNLQLVHKVTGRNLIGKDVTSFARVTVGENVFSASELNWDGRFYRVKFEKIETELTLAINDRGNHLAFEIMSISGMVPDSIDFFSIQTRKLANRGSIVVAHWDDDAVVCLMALNQIVHSHLENNNLMKSTVYQEFGIQGARSALIVAKPADFYDTVRSIEGLYGLPSPMINGQWAKQSPDIDTNYLFIDLSEATAEQVIEYANAGGFKYVLINCSSWALSRGNYLINKKRFPNGKEGIKATIDKFHKAGIKVGMHMLTSLVSKDDPLVFPIPDQRLLKRVAGTLSESIDYEQKEIFLVDAKTALERLNDSRNSFHYISKSGGDYLIDDEIIYCNELETDPPALSNCLRGRYGTTPQRHQKGATIAVLAQGANSFIADLNTSLKDVIANRIAEMVNECGFDMIFFDGGEIDQANGPGWFYIGQMQHAIWKRIERDVLYQGSGINHHLWHLISRRNCDDYAAVATTEYMDHHKMVRLRVERRNFMPVELGWCGLLAGGLDHQATSIEEIMHFGRRMIGYNAPISFQTSVPVLKNNKRTEDILKIINNIDILRSSGRVNESTRQLIRDDRMNMVYRDGDVILRKNGNEIKLNTNPDTQSAVENGDYVPSVESRVTATENSEKPIYEKMSILDSSVSKRDGMASGQLIGRIRADEPKKQSGDDTDTVKESLKSEYWDLSNYRGVSVTFFVKRARSDNRTPDPVINVQLEDERGRYRDHYFDLDFSGLKTITISSTNVDRLLGEFGRPRYKYKKSMRHFGYQSVKAINLRWMKYPSDSNTEYYITRIAAIRSAY